MKMKGTRVAVLLLAVALASGWTPSAEPPELVGFQGVLRDGADQPIDGTYDMVFALFDAASFGNEILLDSHTGGGGVLITGGMFNVPIGSGVVSDGWGPGTYTSLADVFRDHAAVWLEVRVGGETLSPRTRVSAAAYALNASNLAGRDPGEFLDTSTAGQTKYGVLTLEGGVEADGPDHGGVFTNDAGSGVAWAAHGNTGIEAHGSFAGGQFLVPSTNSYAYVARSVFGIQAWGSVMGGEFRTLSDSSRASLAWENTGISAEGVLRGGFFSDSDQSGEARLAAGDVGVTGFGNSHGGYFRDLDSSGYAYVGTGDLGIDAYGGAAGGYFEDANSSGYAWIANGDYGIRAFGNYAGGYFYDLDGTGYARVGYANNGIEAFGDNVGGNFEDTDASGLAHVAWGDRGIWAKGNFAGGTFSYPDNVTIWADVAKYESSGFHYTITGNGQKNFIQNHPEDPDKIIVYASLEGDEVGTYTRGTARLTDGEARIALGETFRWTTHPDVGLTAHLTPHGPTTGLYVASLTTEELVVREQDGGTSDVAFDYMVLGLRIGFEQSPAVRDKEREAPIPDPTTVATFLSDRPELAAFTPLDRFRRMEATVRGVSTEEIDLTGSARLKQAILAAGSRGIGRNETPEPDRLGAGTAPEETETEATPRARRGTEGEQPSADDEAPAAGVETFPVASDTAVGAEPFPRFAVSGPVEAGALLVLDPQTPGVLRLAAAAADPNVVGVATEASRSAEGATVDVAVAGYGFVTVRADASYGPIVAGDLLTSSPTPGHVMQATVAVPGTIVGKALESLDAGTGSIRILVTPR